VESNRKRIGGPQDDELDSAGVTTSLLTHGEVRNSSGTLEQEVNGVESDAGVHRVVGGGTLRSLREISGETCRRGG
jgi:hypothetical protein